MLLALYRKRLEPVRHAVEAGPPPLGPATEPRQRISALLDAVLCFTLGNRRLTLALEEGGNDSPYQAGRQGAFRARVMRLTAGNHTTAATSDDPANTQPAQGSWAG
ncbi:hypothetical protein [Nocardia sp. BMG51109]|uniref:hypothetical protein n=1 Tax=Nocardia sp. BMG51109 TaxID=1056816 RepID=UPI0004668E88|nr:hypothetical protein [Nocardia sp. BMG51109]